MGSDGSQQSPTTILGTAAQVWHGAPMTGHSATECRQADRNFASLFIFKACVLDVNREGSEPVSRRYRRPPSKNGPPKAGRSECWLFAGGCAHAFRFRARSISLPTTVRSPQRIVKGMHDTRAALAVDMN